MNSPNWLKNLLKHLRRMLGVQVERSSVKILEEYHSDGISVLRLGDDSIPGCCELWRIDRHKYENIKFFILILNIQQLREQLAERGVSLRAFAHSRGGMAGQLQAQLDEQADILATHYWITGWQYEVAGIDAKGRSYRSNRTRDLQLVACDLQGTAGSFAGDRHARRFVRKVIKQLAGNEFREYNHHPTWQSAVKAIDWRQWLTGLAQSTNSGIDPNHSLQPKKGRRKTR